MHCVERKIGFCRAGNRKRGKSMEETVFYPQLRFTYEIVHRRNICTTPVLPHTHDATEIYLNLSSLPNALLGNQVFAATPGSLILIPPFCVHQLFDRTDEMYDRYILSVNAPWLDNIFPSGNARYEYLKNGGKPLLISLPASTLAPLQHSFEALLSFQEPDTFDALAAFFSCMTLVDNIVQRCGGSNPKGVRISAAQQTVADIIRYLDEHIQESVSLRDLSEHFYLHPDYISRIFKKHTNTTVGSYITLQKMARARQLLQTGCTVTQAQLMTGYSSYAHFARTFKQQVGIPPGAYRNHGAYYTD